MLGMRAILCVGCCLLASAVLAQPCKPVSFEQSPATVVWTVPVKATNVALAGDLVVVETSSAVMALDSSSGTKRWETSIAHANAAGRSDPMVVTHGRVFVNLGRELRIIALADGHILKNTAMPRWIRMLQGPPLIAVANNAPQLGSTLFALDDDGRIRAQRITRNVEELWLADETIVARMTRNTYNEAPEMNVVAAFRASDLSLLWQFRADGADLQQIDGRWYIGDTSWSPMRSLDLATGQRGAPLPSKPPTDITWGGATWQIETVASSEDRKVACERLRVNDPATGNGWTLDLPFEVTSALRNSEQLYVFGSDETHHFLAAIDWRTGHLEHLWKSIPMLLDRLYVNGDVLVGAGIPEGVFAMRIR
jgi:hypothetical protein